MSIQIALMAGMAAMAAAQAASSASKGAAAQERQIAGLHTAEQQAAYETQMKGMGSQVRQSQLMTQALQTDVTQQEVAIQTAQQEYSRRVMLARLGQSNAIDLVARGGVQTGQDSAGRIDQANRDTVERDIGNIRFIGDAKRQQLDFRKQNILSAVGSEQLNSLFGTIGGDFKQTNLETQVGTAGQRAEDIGVDAMFKIGSTLLSTGGSIAGGASSGGVAGGYDLPGTGAYGMGR